MADRCGICRGSAFTDAIDSNGHPYRGCARCSVASPAKPRRWRKVGPHEYALRMGPVTIEVTRWNSAVTSRTGGADEWGWAATIGSTRFLRGHHADKGAPLEKCQADAIAAVERWRDGIR